jgi:hypothetical protein
MKLWGKKLHPMQERYGRNCCWVQRALFPAQTIKQIFSSHAIAHRLIGRIGRCFGMIDFRESVFGVKITSLVIIVMGKIMQYYWYLSKNRY